MHIGPYSGSEPELPEEYEAIAKVLAHEIQNEGLAIYGHHLQLPPLVSVLLRLRILELLTQTSVSIREVSEDFITFSDTTRYLITTSRLEEPDEPL